MDYKEITKNNVKADIMPPVSLLIKPASSNCNMRCKYCFYHSLAENRDVRSYGIMDIETLEILVEKTLNFQMLLALLHFRVGNLPWRDCTF